MTNILIKAALVLALLAALFFGEQYIEGRGYDRAKTEDQAATNALKAQAAATLAAETTKTRSAEQALQKQTDSQNRKDHAHEKTVTDLSDRLRLSAGQLGRLRDPQAAGCGGGGGSTTGDPASGAGAGAADPAQAGGLLSAGLTGLLQRLTLEADTINTAYASCRADAYTVRAPP